MEIQFFFSNFLVPQPRLITTQAANTNASGISGQVVSVSGVRTTSGISSSLNAASSGSKPEILKIGGKTAVITQPQSLIQSQQLTGNATAPKIVQAQLQPITAQQLVNAKVLGVQGFQQGITQVTPVQQRVKAGTASIRMVNASNLNIANIDGKPIIIAKTPSMMQSSNQASGNKTIWTQQGGTLAKANIIGTLPAAQQTTQQVIFGNQIVKIQPQQTATAGHSNTSTMSVLNINSAARNNSMSTAPSASIASQVPTKTAVLLSSTGQAIKVHAPNVITTNAASFKPTVKVIHTLFLFFWKFWKFWISTTL